MSFIPNKASVLGALIILATACTTGVYAQTHAAINSLTVNPNSISETMETDEEKKSAPPAAGTILATGPVEVSDVNPPSKVSTPVTARAGTVVATEMANEAPSSTMMETRKTATANPQPAPDDKWHFQFSPYFWLASLHGTGGVGGRTTQVDMSFGDIFGSLKFALMGVFEARKGKFILLTDMEYVSIEDDKATPGPLFSNVNAKFKTFIFDPEVGYRLFDNPAKGQSIDVLGGIRVWHVSTELDFGAGILPATQVQGSRNWVDGIVGLRGRAALSEKAFVTGKFDLGGGGSNFTWQFFGAGGYNVKPNIALIFGYRVLDVNYNKDNFIYDMNQRGPIMGLGFKF